ncbi:hypothetical protein AAG742_10720 [Micrococcus sp. 2A]|uniref:hypothetical protein n=1 Tax=Actinomycetes TaxID=1760 RepID=UPI00130DDB5F|nr:MULTISPECIES: hypothetical protein [Micrococcus]MCF8560565.1 hypothetical protein [Micrococcus yunnanensis]MCV7684972.1 hypothetical protein [Micrococcus luteus]MCV7732168.1 hypothetical protein [Micrococcus luteus]UBH25208.1 hypothetical protein KW076_03180 [Micrococcus porci]
MTHQPPAEPAIIPSDTTHDQTADRKRARQWLKTLNVSPNPELVEGLIPLVSLYPKKSVLGFYAGRLLKKGKLPTEEAVLKLLWGQLEQIIYSIKALESRTGRDPFITPEQETEILQWVDNFWAQHGEGPLWSELAENFHWSRTQQNRLIHYLAARGLVTFSFAPRSLKTVRGATTIPSLEGPGSGS